MRAYKFKKSQRGFLGALIGGIADFFGGERANKANAFQAEQNRLFQERMSSTSYQRVVEDMKAAGLNPMLAYQQGGASSPGGSMPAPMQNTMGSAVHTAMAYKRQAAEVENIKADTANKIADLPGRQAEASRLQQVAEDYPQWTREILKSERFLMAAKEDIARWNLSYEEKRLRISEKLLDQTLPAELRERIASAVLKEVEAKYHPYKLVAPAIGAAAGAASAFGVGKLLHGYGAMKGARKALGSGEPAVFRHRRPMRAHRQGESGYQYTRPLPGPSKY